VLSVGSRAPLPLLSPESGQGAAEHYGGHLADLALLTAPFTAWCRTGRRLSTGAAGPGPPAR
jgi:hypothetical protein